MLKRFFYGLALTTSACAMAHTPVPETSDSASCVDFQWSRTEAPESPAALGITRLSSTGLMTPVSSWLVEAPCAARIVYFDGAKLLLTNGSTLMKDGAGGIVPVKNDRLRFKTERVGKSLDGDWKGYNFLYSYPMGGLPGDRKEYKQNIGVWRGDSSNQIRAFLTKDGEIVGEPVAIANSERPIRSVAYQPYPDSGIGILSLVVDNEDGSASVIALTWVHRQIFDETVRHNSL